MRRIELRPLDPHQPGYGQLVIIGGQGDGQDFSLDIQRNQDENFLQEDGQWRSNAFRFHLPPFQQGSDAGLMAVVDDRIVDPLLENTNATYMARLYGPDGAEVGRARLRLANGLMPSGASGSSPSPQAGGPLVTPQPTTAQPESSPAPEPSAEPPPPTEPTEQPPHNEGKKRRRWPWILLGVLILAAVMGGTAWFGMHMRDQGAAGPGDDTEEIVDEDVPLEDTTDESETNETETTGEEVDNDLLGEVAPIVEGSAATAGPCALERMGEMSELEFIQACTAAGNEAGDMLNVVDQALANEHCGIARRLYAHQALNGNAAAALAYAREFDPQHHAPSACFQEPDTETAIFWYETVLSVDSDNSEASQRLEALQR